MKRFSTFLLTLMLLVFTTEAFAQGGPRRVEVYGDDTKSAAIGDFITATDGVKCEVLSENMVQNHSFELGLSGTWVNTADWTTPIAEPDFIQDDTAPLCDGAQYLVGKTNGGANSTGSLGNSWKLEKGKTYYFSYWVKSLTGTTNGEYLKVSLTNNIGKEPSDAGYESSSDWLINGSTVQSDGEWHQIDAYFTNTEGYEYLQIKFRWLNSQWGFDKFELYEVDAYTDTESDYYEGDLIIMNEGDEVNEARYVAMSNNMVDNHSFELGLVNWYGADLATDATTGGYKEITSSNFSLKTDNPQDGKRYLVGVNSDVASSAKSLFNYWPIEDGKSYYFSYYIKAQNKVETDAQYIKTSLTNTLGTEDIVIDDGTKKETTTEWKLVEVPFTNTDGYKYLQIKFRWLDGLWGFDNFNLYEVEEAEPELIVHKEEAELNDWSRTSTKGNFQRNTWSEEADASGMVTPFIEYWIGAGSALPDATISHKTITKDDNGDALKGGFYTMSIDVRAFNEKSRNNVKPGTITLKANETSVDISLGSMAIYSNVSAETYGTFEVPFMVEADASGDNSIGISFEISGTNCDWFAFKNLVVTYMGTGQDMPSASELHKVTGTMSATAAAAQDAAFAAYESDHHPDNLIAIYQALVDAKLSANYYAELEALVNALDEAGREVWDATTSGQSYATLSLEVTDDYTTDMANAQAAQTTAGSNMTYVMRNGATGITVDGWKNAGGTTVTNSGTPEFNRATVEVYNGSGVDAGTVLYKTITGLTPGIYEVSFYANASLGTVTAGGAKVYANDNSELIDTDTPGNDEYETTGWRDQDLRTLTCVVNSDGKLTYGIDCEVKGALWYIAMDSELNASLTLVGNLESASEHKTGDIITVDGVDYELASDNMVANHSFEQGVAGWYTTDDGSLGQGIFSEEISQENFAFMSDGASDGTWYLVGTEDGGKDSPLSLGNYWELAKSTSYYFSFDIKAMGDDTNANTLSVSLTNDLGVNTRTQDLMDGVNPVSKDWQTVEMVFRNSDYKYLQMLFYELQGKWGFDNFQLYALTTPTVLELVAHEEEYEIASYDASVKNDTPTEATTESFSHWSIAGNTNGAFQLNTWSAYYGTTEPAEPWFEYWVAGGSYLSAATISHKTIVGLPAGTYEVSIYANANNESEDAISDSPVLNANGKSLSIVEAAENSNGEYNYYGTYTLDVEVTDGTLDISFDVPANSLNWFLFKNLKVSMTTTVTEDMPVIEALEGKMSADAEKAMTDAIAAYEAACEADPLVVADVESTFTAAIDALQAAQESIDEYAEIAALVDALDEAGKKVWDATTSGAAYEAGTLDATADWTADMTVAQAAQTTEGTDWTYVLKYTGEWKYDELSSVTNFQLCPVLTTAHEAWRATTFGGSEEEPSMPLYKEIADLPAGTYTISFYAYAAQGAEGDVVVFANDATSTITVDATNAGPNWSNEAELITLTCEVGEDGILDFGLKCIGAGAWYVAEEATLTFVEVYVEAISDDEYAEGDNVDVDGQNYKITSGNLFVNGGFNDAINVDGTVPGWTCTNEYTDPLLAENVIIATAGGFNNGGYLTLKESVGASNEMTPTQAIKVTPGSTYLFIGYTNGTEPTDANIRYSALFAMQSATEESHHDEDGTSFGDDIVILDWESDGEWTQTMAVFTATTDYVGMRMNWSVGSYDGFQLYEVNAPRITPGDYLVVNPETGNYLAGGLYGGTEAMEGGKPQFIGFEATDDGRYILDSYQSNGGDNHYIGLVGNEMYFDTAGCTWLVLKDVNTDLIYIGTEIVVGTEEVTDENGEKVTQDVKELRWVKSRGFQNAVEWVENIADCTPWTLVTKADVLATMEEATADEPVDVTALIPASEPKSNAWGASWTMTAYDGESTINNGTLGQKGNPASVAESYHSSNGFLFTQIVPDLPVGTYKLTAQAFYRNDIADEAELVVPVMYADDVTAELPELPELTDEEIEAGITVPANMVDAYQAFLLEEYPVELMFYVAEEGDVEIGFSSELATNDQLWTIFGELGLLYYGEENLTEPEPEPVPDTEHECVAEIDHWSIAGNTNGDFHYNDWSTEADASGMVVPFLEYWVGSWEGNLSAATISHYTLYMEPGTYQVSLDARIFSEAGNEIGEGTTLNANDASLDLVAAGTADVYGTETEVYGTYTLICEVGEDGLLDISINIPEGVTYNWIAFKNLVVTPYTGQPEDIDYEIGDVVTIDDVEYTVVGENLFVNGGFNADLVEDENGNLTVPGWTQGNGLSGDDAHNYQDALLAENVTLTEGGYNGLVFMTTASAGASSAKTPTQAIAVEVGKTYMLVAYTSGVTPDEQNLRYSALFEMEDATTEANHYEEDTPYSNTIIQLAWGATPKETSEEWTKTLGVFTATTEYVGMRMGWSSGSYDGFQLYEVEGAEVEPEPEADTEHECVAEISHWTTDGNTEIVYNDWSVEADASGMVTPFLQLWVWSGDATQPSLEAATISHETLTMEPGTYEVSLDIRIFSEAGNEIGEGTTLSANGVSVDLLTEGSTGTYATNDYPNMTEVYGTYTITCEVGEDGTLDISINIPEGVEYNWIAWKNLSVTQVEVVEPEPEPEPTYTLVHECVAEESHWTTDGTTGIGLNTWSVEADASGMVTPFLQLWVWSGDATQPSLEAATISHETLTDLQPGTYTVVLDARIFSEAGNEIGEGTTLSANGVSVDLLTEGSTGTYATDDYPNMTEVYGTYTITCEVGEDGTLDISINIPEGVEYNWIAWKNLKVYYHGEILSYEFVCTDWGSIDLERVSDSNVTYDEESNTIIVSAGTGENNVALSNGREAPFTTENYTVSSEQNWFVVVASDIVTDLEASALWWMNGVNDGTFYPDYIVELESGEILVAWDLTATTIDGNLTDDVNYLNGWTGFGLTSTSGVSVVSDINFYTWEDAVEKYPELSSAIATEIAGVETEKVAEGIYTLSGVRISKITKSGIYIVDGKKVLVK